MTPEEELRALFREEQALNKELEAVRAKITGARLRYMAKHRTYGLRVETLRKAVA